MAEKIIMPKQGLQMTEGTITRWLKKEGDKVELDEPLFEMETDKLNIEMTSTASGTLLKIIKKEGDVVPITETIAFIGDPDEIIPQVLDRNEAEIRSKIYSTPRSRMRAKEKGINISDVRGTGPEDLIIERDVDSFSMIKGTPLARKPAEINEISLEDVDCSGKRGKIMKTDIEARITARRGSAVERIGKTIPFRGMRKAIANNIMKSIHGMAQANHRMKVDMTEVVRFKEKLKAAGIKVSYTDIIVKIVSKVLLEFPIINSELTSEGILIKDFVNMGLAVAIENGLIVPVIMNADLMTLEEISTVSKELAEKAKTGKLESNEYKNGTFTITNLGMFDIDEFTAIINPPEAAILAVGKIDKVPVVENDQVVIKPVMVLSLTYDHRIIDGAPAAQFLQRVKQIMQNLYLLI